MNEEFMSDLVGWVWLSADDELVWCLYL